MQTRDHAQQRSIIKIYGYQNGSCGYCKDPTSSQRTQSSRTSYYIKSSRLTAHHYQDLVDRGWRRSGSLLYKPDVKRSCCPHYSIRLPVADFKPSRDQRQALNKWNYHVQGEDYVKEASRLYPKSKEEKARDRNHFHLPKAVHASELNQVKQPPSPAHKFVVTLEPDTFTSEKYALYEHYQTVVHHELPAHTTTHGFRNFLCDSPLVRSSREVDGKLQMLGSYHQCYRLDERLIAIAVLDFLPSGISSVYFLYHTDYERFAFGKLSALREITLALEYDRPYYIMGYYIHSCPKMRYKGSYKPQYVLDPESNEWDPLDGELIAKLAKRKYVSLSRDRNRDARRLAAVDLPARGIFLGKNGDDLQNSGDGDTNNRNDENNNDDNDNDDDSDDENLSPIDAVNSGASLFDLGFPGILSLSELHSQINLGEILIHIGRGSQQYQLQDLSVWDTGDPADPNSLVGMVAELAASVGARVAREMVVDLS